jgi:4-alpha-glucanotransferase
MALPEWMQRLPTARAWEHVGAVRRSGINLPLSSLRSARGLGVGDLGDLPVLGEWCRALGASVIQLLPLNDIGLDRGPYAALSAFATDLLYLAVDAVGAVTTHQDLAESYRTHAAHLNQGRRVDFAAVRQAKLGLMEEAFRRAAPDSIEQVVAPFAAANPWLEDYVLFRALKEAHGWRSWEEWGDEARDPAAIDAFRRAHADRLQLHRWVQALLDGQLREAHARCNALGVLLKGDVPILIGRDSADVWRHPRYFRLDTCAGAPPDMYAAEGQNWGFPTYDWEALARDDYGWWRDRLRHAARYYDLYRIDHVVGFFRIWTIRHGERSGLHGWFVPGDEATWGEHGRRLLSMMIETTSMLPLAEDLGTIPDVCRRTLGELGVCGMKVARWEKRWHGDRTFIPPAEYPALSLATLSTHDSATVAGWWHDEPNERQQQWQELGHGGPAPQDLPPWLAEDLVRRLSRGGSIFAMHLLQDLLYPFGRLVGGPADNRVNVPGVVNDSNWTWRMPVTLEGLLADEPLTARLRELLAR